MASITITIPDTIAQRTLNGFCKYYGYLSTLTDGSPNPETKMQFAKRKLIELIKNAVRNAETENASEAAIIAARNSVDIDIQLS